MEIDIKSFLDLPKDEKRKLAETLWDSLEQDDKELQLLDEEKSLLEERMSSLKEGRSSLTEWKEVKKKILTSKR